MSLEQNTTVAKWCKEKNVFSFKTNGGYYLPNGEFLTVPSGITRCRCGTVPVDAMGFRKTCAWRIEVALESGTRYKAYVADSDYGGDYLKSFEKALETIKKIKNGKLHKSGTRINNVERTTKKYKIDIPGISISKHTDSRNGRITYRFIISVGEKKKSLTIGTSLDFNSEEYKYKLELAKNRHATLVRERAIATFFTGRDQDQ